MGFQLEEVVFEEEGRRRLGPVSVQLQGKEMVGVVGPLCGIIGGAMALEALKIITGAGRNLIGRLAIFDALAWRWREVCLEPDPDCPGCSSSRNS